MALSPLALACLVAGAATAVRRAELSPALLRFEGRLGVAACVTMAVFLGGGCAWLAGRTAPPGSPFRPGAIDVAGLAVMALALGGRVPGRPSGPARPGMTPNGPGSRWTRRRVLTLGLAPVGGPGLRRGRRRRAGLPRRAAGRTLLEELDGACSVPAPPLDFAPPGPSADGTFYSAARRRTVGYTIAYPPGHRRGGRPAAGGHAARLRG